MYSPSLNLALFSVLLASSATTTACGDDDNAPMDMSADDMEAIVVPHNFQQIAEQVLYPSCAAFKSDGRVAATSSSARSLLRTCSSSAIRTRGGSS